VGRPQPDALVMLGAAMRARAGDERGQLEAALPTRASSTAGTPPGGRWCGKGMCA